MKILLINSKNKSKYPHQRGVWRPYLEKSRAARARTTAMAGKNRDLASDNEKSEDPAKMTYSIPDFVSRTAINTQ